MECTSRTGPTVTFTYSAYANSILQWISLEGFEIGNIESHHIFTLMISIINSQMRLENTSLIIVTQIIFSSLMKIRLEQLTVRP